MIGGVVIWAFAGEAIVVSAEDCSADAAADAIKVSVAEQDRDRQIVVIRAELCRRFVLASCTKNKHLNE